MDGADGGRWSIGALARASGVTVRALHHYDRIGLLPPAERSPSGHRRYDAGNVRRLYRIRALRALGLSLDEIAGVLRGRDGGGDDLAELRGLLTAQLRDLDREAGRLDEVRARIRGLLGQIDTDRMPDPDQFMTTLELMSLHEKYFTPQQWDDLARRRAEIGPDGVEAAKLEWVGIVDRLLPHVAADTPIDDPRVVDLVARWDALGERMQPAAATTRQRAELRSAVGRMWREHGAEIGVRLPWSVPDMTGLVAYVERVRGS